ncbi:MAG: DUF2101 domain-containing protein, partial [Euryarchaeota archaeon]|nr:DUF2101 domain-containing protein [Euryarchaeota archaeon]
MGILEDIGEATINIANRLAYIVLGILIAAVRTGGKGLQVLKKVNLYPPFEKRGVEYRDYVVLKTQVATLVFLITAVTYIFTAVSPKLLALLLVLSGGCSLYLVFTDVKDSLPDDFAAYRDFFLSYLGISFLLILVKKW